VRGAAPGGMGVDLRSECMCVFYGWPCEQYRHILFKDRADSDTEKGWGG